MKIIIGLTGVALVAVLGIQQYQLNRITTDVVEIKEDIKFITQSKSPLVTYSIEDENCLAKNIYYEAGIEGDNGKYSVAQVTMNRLKTGRWGTTICSVVYAKAQFSWTLKKKLHKPRGKTWEDSQWIAHRVLRGEEVPVLKQAKFYHADYVNPKWKDNSAHITQVGTHIFYSKAKYK